jgi:hypothetical protein
MPEMYDSALDKWAGEINLDNRIEKVPGMSLQNVYLPETGKGA